MVLKSRATHYLSGCGVGVFAAVQYGRSIYKHVLYTRRVLMRLGKGGVILDGGGIENDYIGKIARLQTAASIQLERVGGEGG